MSRTVSVTEAKRNLGAIVEEVKAHRSAVAVTKHRTRAVYVVDALTYEHLRDIEDQWLAARLRARLDSEETRPLEDVIRDLGLDV